MGRTVPMNVRLERSLAEEVDRIAQIEALRRTDLLRKWILEGMRRWKIEHAIQRYTQGEISLARAAEEAEVDLREMMDILRRRRIRLDVTTPQDVERRVALLEQFSVG